MTCSSGTWTQSPTHFAYQWSRSGTLIQGATSARYAVRSSDEQLTLVCAVIASNTKGSSAPALSSGVAVPVPHVAGCPAARGELAGAALGQVKLGMTRAQARRALRHSRDKTQKYSDTFCLTPVGVRVGYASPALLKTLAKSKRSKVESKVVWVSTSSAFYTVRGVRVGATLAAARRALKSGVVIKAGGRAWYVSRLGSATVVLAVRGGLIQELCLVPTALTAGHKTESAMLGSIG